MGIVQNKVSNHRVIVTADYIPTFAFENIIIKISDSWLFENFVRTSVYVCVFACVCMCVCVHVCVCLSPRLLITSGVMWQDMDPIRLVKQARQLLYGNYSIAQL